MLPEKVSQISFGFQQDVFNEDICFRLGAVLVNYLVLMQTRMFSVH